MGFYLSPLVDVKEIDLSGIIPAVATSIGVIVLRGTYKGPERKRKLITSEDELISVYGETPRDIRVGLNVDAYEDMNSAMAFLKDSNTLYCTRIMPSGATFAGTKAVTGSSATFTAYTSADAYQLSDFASLDPDEFHNEDTMNPGVSNNMFIIANSSGEWGNNLRLAVCDFSTYNKIASGDTVLSQNDLGDNVTYGVYNTIRNVDEPLDDSKDFLIVVQECPRGKDITVTSNFNTVEVWNVSTDETKIDDDGNYKFAESKINAQSEFIRVSMEANQKNSTMTCYTSAWQYLGGGINSEAHTPDWVDNDETSACEYALDLYKNSEEIDVNIFIDSNKNETVKEYMVSICESRMDCIAVLDCPKAHVLHNTNSETDDLIAWRTGYTSPSLNINTSYAAVYSNWCEIFDKYATQYRWIPMSGYAAGVFARTDYVADPWFAPAGLNRAILKNIRRLAWNPDKGDRDMLYKNGLNPVVSFAGQGKVIWGQKTMLDKASSFNRVNVRRLFIVLEKAISTAAKYFLFEPNDSFTRMQLINIINPFLRDVQGRRGIYEFLTVCDNSNNTPTRIDRNELWADIYIKPTRTAEFVVLNFIATQTGASFTELAAARANPIV